MERKKVISRLKHSGAIYRCQGIICAARQNMADEETVKLLRGLKNDPVRILGRQVGWYAIAALEMLGVEKYTGDEPLVIEFIDEFPAAVSALPDDFADD